MLFKFAIVPFYQQQSEQLDELQVLNKRLGKVLALQETEPQLQQNLFSGKKTLELANEGMWQTEHDEQLDVAIQSRLQNWFEQKTVSVQLFSWVGEQPTMDKSYVVARAQLRLQASQAQLAHSILQLEASNKFVSVAELKWLQPPQFSDSGVTELLVTFDILIQRRMAP
jgi:hypothetical protein